jgi:hypothetical protein
MIDEVTNMIAKVRNHNPELCNEKCQCRPLAAQIILLIQQHHANDQNRLTEMLADRTDELIRLKRLVGDEA